MSPLKLTNTFLMLYVFGMLISDYPMEGASINERTQDCCPADDMCVLPAYPDHGQYNASMGLKPGDAAPNVSLTYSCDRGYSLRGKGSPACVNGTWSEEAPTCTNQCKPLKSNSVDFKCYKQNSIMEISCTLPQDNNTHAKAQCKDFYFLEPAPKDLICINGSWDYMPYCVLECGTVAPKVQTLIINGMDAQKNEFPWHVGLYDKTLDHTPQICGGSIFTPNLVVTAAHCVSKHQTGKYPGELLAVAAGKLYRRWDSRKEDEKYVQKIDVMKIEIPERYKGIMNAYMADIAVLVLERSFVLSSFVRPVCIQFDSNQNLDGQYGRVAGWGLIAEDGPSSDILRTVSLPYVSYQTCYSNSKESFHSLLTDDKICAGYTNGTALCQGDSGGGLVFSYQNNDRKLYHLHGIVSNSPRNEAQTSCSAFSYTGFTNTFKHQEWLEDICLREWGCENGGCISLEKRCSGKMKYCTDGSDNAAEFCSNIELSISNSRCILPAYPIHGNYNATIGHKPGDVVSSTVLTYSCDEGYILNGGVSHGCNMGTWFGDVPSCKLEFCGRSMVVGTCKPRTECPDWLIIGIGPQFCDFAGETVYACCLPDRSVRPKHSNYEDAINPVVDCGPIPAKATKVKKTGWKARDKCIDYLEYVYPCEEAYSLETKKVRRYQCNHKVTDLVVKENDAVDGEFPHMARLGHGSSEDFDWICGGTVISDRYIMTTAECATTFLTHASGNVLVHVGMTNKSAPIDQSRIYKAADIIRHPDYKWPNRYYDLALIKTATTIKLDNRVYPACLHTGYTVNDDLMVGIGWGYTNYSHHVSKMLQKITLVKFTPEQCQEFYELGSNYQPELQICAGPYTDDQDMCEGFKGGPIQIFNSDVNCMYTVLGVASFDLNMCGKVVPSIFTRVAHYIPWIESIVWP